LSHRPTLPHLSQLNPLRSEREKVPLAVVEKRELGVTKKPGKQHPALHDLDLVLHGERAPPDGALVPILIAHFDELRYLLQR
jgi:hypothetical protein